GGTIFLPQWRKEDDFAQGMLTSEHHHKPIYTQSKTTGRRHAVSQSAQVVLVHRVALFIIFGVSTSELKKAFFLIERVIKLSESVAKLHPTNIALETFHC